MPASVARLFAVAVAIWGTTWLAITFQLGVVPPEASVTWRFGLAAAIIFGVCRARRLPLRFPARVHALLLLFGLAMFCAGYLFVYHAETLLVSGLVALAYSASPLANMALARLVLGTPMSARLAAGGLVGLCGVALVFWPEMVAVRAEGATLRGVLYAAAGVLSSSLGSVLAGVVARHGLDVWQKMAWGMAYGAAGCLAAALVSGQPLAFEWTLRYTGSLLYLSVLGSVVAFAAYLTLLARAGPTRAGYVGVMVPIVALVVSTFAEGFAWGWQTVVGVALAAAGNVVILGRASG